jgi:hypothetical protein
MFKTHHASLSTEPVRPCSVNAAQPRNCLPVCKAPEDDNDRLVTIAVTICRR